MALQPNNAEIRYALFGVAGVVEDGRCALTNNAWVVDTAQLCARFGFAGSHIVNDFEAVAWSLPLLAASDLGMIGGGPPKRGAPMVVVGPGTGLGVAAYIPGKGGSVVARSEGAHTTLPSASSLEDAIIEQLRNKFDHVSAERALSGNGLENLYQAIALLELRTDLPERSAAAITRAGIAGSCAASRAALDTFCALLGKFAGNFALSFDAQGGVFIAGGIAPHLRDYLPQSRFRSRLNAKGRMSRSLEGNSGLFDLARGSGLHRPAVAGHAAALEFIGSTVMANVVTLTPNPAIDVSTAVDRVVPMLKLRCTTQRRDPGGGGINVARVVKRFGGDVEAILPEGGATGDMLRRLIEDEGVPNRIVPVEAATREDFSVTELSTDTQYRFVLPGQPLREAEWRACLSALAATAPAPRLVVGSGSLPPGVPSDFYAQAAAIAAKLGARFFLDTSGPALAAAIEHGVTLIKPNLNEMRQLIGAEFADPAECIVAARKIIRAGQVEIVALSLGHLGALLITREEVLRASPLLIQAKSSVGAGDSFLGAMVFSIAKGGSLVDALRLGVAAGAAALINEGTELCPAAEAYRLSAQVQIESL